jgi:hypothetical protein
MQIGRLVILIVAVLITAGEAIAILHATASVDSRRDTSETPILLGAAPPSPDLGE